MSDGSEGMEIQEVQPAITIADSAVSRLNREGYRNRWEPLDIVDSSREALVRMPEGKTGIVIGSGPNTAEWKGRGWKTLDINPAVGADMTVDANHLETVVMPGTEDYIFAECVKFDPKGNEGVSPSRLLQQANKTLRTGGLIIVEGVNLENYPDASSPPRKQFAALMTQHGFNAVVEVTEYHHFGEDSKEQRVYYYGRKVATGYDESRTKQTSATSPQS